MNRHRWAQAESIDALTGPGVPRLPEYGQRAD